MTAPYYQDDLVTLYLGSCLDVTEWLDADVLITDPPYGLDAPLSRTPHRGNKTAAVRSTAVHTKPEWDRDLTVRDNALDLWGTEKPYAVFGSAARLDGAVPHRGVPLIWDKLCVGMGDTDFPWGRAYELIYVNGPGWHTAGELRRTPIIRVQHLTRDAGREGHPSTKPLPLMGELVRKAPPGVIADPFSGSGSTLRAAKDEGRRAVGVELDERYCEITANRLGQDTLFGGVA